MGKQTPHQPNKGGGGKSYFVKLYKSKEKFKEERATHTGGYESTNSLTSRTCSTDATVSSNTLSKPPTNITTDQMYPTNQ